MARKKKGSIIKIVMDAPKTRWCPDPHKRHNVIESKKLYNRKARHPQKAGPSDFSAGTFDIAVHAAA